MLCTVQSNIAISFLEIAYKNLSESGDLPYPHDLPSPPTQHDQQPQAGRVNLLFVRQS